MVFIHSCEEGLELAGVLVDSDEELRDHAVVPVRCDKGIERRGVY